MTLFPAGVPNELLTHTQLAACSNVIAAPISEDVETRSISLDR